LSDAPLADTAVADTGADDFGIDAARFNDIHANDIHIADIHFNDICVNDIRAHEIHVTDNRVNETPAYDSDNRPIDQRIRQIYENLTGNERRLADVVLGARGNLASFTAAELAARANVSTATTSRFFQRLGYRTYHDARRLTREQLAWGSPLHELLHNPRQRSNADDFGRHIANDVRNLTRTVELVDPKMMAEAVRLLAGARTIWLIGFRNSMALALYARALLVNAKSDVRLIPTPGMTLAEELASFGKDDCMLALSFRRRPKALRDTLALAAEFGLRSVVVTDLSAVRSVQHATAVLRCQTVGHGLFDSYTAVMSVLNFLCTGVARELGDATIERLQRIEALHGRLGDSTVAPSLPTDSSDSTD
jgi:DNA-binding MurR/RpiR family transcriptional regulator